MEIARVNFETRSMNVRVERIERLGIERLTGKITPSNRLIELVIPQVEHQLEIRMTTEEASSMIKFIGHLFDEVWNPYNGQEQRIFKFIEE